MNGKLVHVFVLVFIVCSSICLEAASECREGRRDADAPSPAGPAVLEVVGQVLIEEGQQGKADEVTVKTDLTTYRIKPTPTLNDLLNFEKEMRFRLFLERVDEGNAEAWQIVRYMELPLPSASQRIGANSGNVLPAGSRKPAIELEGASAKPVGKNGKKLPSAGSCRPVLPARESDRKR